MLNAENLIEKMNVGILNMFGYKQDDLQNIPIKILFNSVEYKALQRYINNAENANDASSTKKIELNGLRQDNTKTDIEHPYVKEI